MIRRRITIEMDVDEKHNRVKWNLQVGVALHKALLDVPGTMVYLATENLDSGISYPLGNMFAKRGKAK